jgi:hypothetical protein
MSSLLDKWLGTGRSQTMRLEDGIKFEPKLKAFMTPTKVHSDEGPIASIESKTESSAPLHVAEIEFTSARENLSGVEKDGHIETAECFPPILGCQVRHVLVAEAKGTKTPQVVPTAQCGLHVEGNNLSSV